MTPIPDPINTLINLAKKKFGQLTNAEEKLFYSVARHETANFKADVDELNQFESVEQWEAECTLKADRIVWLLTTPEVSKKISFRGLQISGAIIEGELNLEYATVSVPLIFEYCEFTEPLILQKSKLRELQLKDSCVLGIRADEMEVEGSVSLCDKFISKGKVSLMGAKIKGNLNCMKGQFINPKETALDASQVQIFGQVYFHDCFKAEGKVSLQGATIRGLLSCQQGTFYNPDADGIVINANGADIAADVFLSNNFKAEGEVNLLGASIGGQLICIGGKFSNKGQTAIQAATATIAPDVFLCNGFKAEGEVNLRRASIGGQLDCFRGNFNNPDGFAINVNGAKIAGSVFLRNDLKAEGELMLVGVAIGGQLDCFGGEFSNPDGVAINADSATIAADVFLSNNFKAEGEVNLIRASIGGNFRCTGGHFLNKMGTALDAEGAKIGGSVFLGGKSDNSQFQAEGKMIFLNATIDDRLELDSIESNNSKSVILDLRFAKVTTFSFKNRQAEESWIKHIKPGQLFLNGFVYSTIHVTNDAIKNKDLLKWLQLQIKKDPVIKNQKILKRFQLQIKKCFATQTSENGFVLQPYEQLAKVLKENGHQEAATKVLIAKENDRLRHGGLGFWSKFSNRILGATIAHGYRPKKALSWSVLMILIGWGIFTCGDGLGLMTETNSQHRSYAVFNPLFYSIDTFTPIIDLHQQKMWLPDASKGKAIKIPLLPFKRTSGDLLCHYLWFQIIVGWVLTSLWVVGFTGLVRSKK